MRLGDIVRTALERGREELPRGQTEGPIQLSRSHGYALCRPCTEIQRRANPAFEGEIGWLAHDIERHLREYHHVGDR